MGSSQLTSSPSYWLKSLSVCLNNMSYQRKFQEDMQRATGRFQDLVQENKVMMFSSTNCSYCDIAKETFQSMGTQFKSLEVNKLGVDGAMMKNTLKPVTGERTVPAIFICGEPTLEHAGTVLQGRRNMWVMATSAMTSSSQDCLITIIIGGDFFLPRLSRHHHHHHRHRRRSLLPKIVSE